MAAWLLAVTLAGCSGTTESVDAGPDAFAGPAGALFELPRNGTPPPSGFYALPFPNDVRVDEITGEIDLRDYVRPNALLDTYVDTIQQYTRGFSITAASFVRFDGPIDVDSLPVTPEASLADDASVYMVNVDIQSNRYGERIPLTFRFERLAGETIGTNWLSALPYAGFVLEEEATYALVVTDRLRASDGSLIAIPAEFSQVMDSQMSSDPEVARAQSIYQPLTSWLDEPGGDERSNLVVASVFTTQDATSLVGDMRQAIWDQLPMPTPSQMVPYVDEDDGESEDYYWYDGVYDAPCFQAGTPPHTRPEDGGNIIVDPETGLPIIQRTMPLRFSFTIPKRLLKPANGWPVVFYAHGTGGSYHSFVNSGVAAQMARAGIAMISIDQVMHEPRIPEGSSPEILFFNFQNPLAVRDNTLQGAADNFQLLRLALAFQHSTHWPGPQNITFDPERMYFFGHSQGGLTGPPFLAHEPMIKGAVLSGAGGLLYLSLILKTEPVDIAGLVSTFIRDFPMDEFNPVLALLQMYIDRSDPVAYGPLLVREPRPGIAPKHIFQSEGFTDRFTPLRSIEALAVAIGVDLVEPVIREVHGLALRGNAVLPPPVTGNRNGVTAALLQYNQDGSSDGHFVIFDLSDGRKQSSEFLISLAETGAATVVAP